MATIVCELLNGLRLDRFEGQMRHPICVLVKGVNENVDDDAWAAWLALHKDSSLVVDRMVWEAPAPGAEDPDAIDFEHGDVERVADAPTATPAATAQTEDKSK